MSSKESRHRRPDKSTLGYKRLSNPSTARHTAVVTESVRWK